MENNGSPYNRATATWSTTWGMDAVLSCISSLSSVEVVMGRASAAMQL
jgi:hypothetical protein